MQYSAIKGKHAKASELWLGVEWCARAHANAWKRELHLCLRVKVKKEGVGECRVLA